MTDLVAAAGVEPTASDSGEKSGENSGDAGKDAGKEGEAGEVNKGGEAGEFGSDGKNAEGKTAEEIEAAAKGEKDPATKPAEGEWFHADGVKGEGDKPDWLADKYKSVAEQAKAYVGLNKKIGDFQGAPEKYEIPEIENAKFDAEDPVLNEFMDFAKEKNMSQELFNDLMGKYVGVIKGAQPDAEAEMKKLGVNAKQDLQILSQWASNNLDQNEYNLFKSMMKTADVVQLFDKIRVKATNPDISLTKSAAPGESEASIRQMIHDPRYEKEPAFRELVREKMKMIKS